MSLTKMECGVNYTTEVLKDNVNGLIDLSSRAGMAVEPIVLDMHFNILQGTPCRSSEVKGTVVYSVITQAPAGGSILELSSSNGIVQGQLITALGVDGLYSAHKVESVNDNQLVISPSLSSGLDAGNNVFNFYSNEYHPNSYGYKAIADSLVSAEQFSPLTYIKYVIINRVSAGSTATESVTASANKIGVSGSPSLDVTLFAGGNVSQYIATPSSGIYTVEFFAVTNGVPLSVNAAGSILLTRETGAGRYSFDFFSTGENSTTTITFTLQGGVSGSFQLSRKVLVARKSGVTPNINNGRHLMLGDSWFATNTLVDRMAERLPDATFINKGVGGRSSAGVLAAIDVDYDSEYDFVWLMVGTNDYVAGIPPETFRKTVASIISKIKEKGATPIIISPSVAPIDTKVSEFEKSRLYVVDEYRSRIEAIKSTVTSFGPVTLLNGESANIAELGLFEGEFSIQYSYAVGQGLSIVSKSSLNSAGNSLIAVADNSPSSVLSQFNLGTNRWVSVRASNTSGVAQTYYGYIKHSTP